MRIDIRALMGVWLLSIFANSAMIYLLSDFKDYNNHFKCYRNIMYILSWKLWFVFEMIKNVLSCLERKLIHDFICKNLPLRKFLTDVNYCLSDYKMLWIFFRIKMVVKHDIKPSKCRLSLNKSQLILSRLPTNVFLN